MVTKEQITAALNVDLFDYLICNHFEDISTCGEWLRFLPDPSVNIKAGRNRWKDYSGKHTINGHEWLSSIDFLMIFYDFSFVEAVEELIENGSPCEDLSPNLCNDLSSSDIHTHVKLPKREFTIPEKDTEQYIQTVAYLTQTRKIPMEVVTNLIKADLLYQTTIYNPSTGKPFHNMVFLNKDKNYYETHGTMSFGKSFHGCGKQRIDNYWCIKKGENPQRVYICEAAIDAISLFVLHCYQGIANGNCYASIGGCDNFKTIERLRKEYPTVILAVDNDSVTNSKDNAGQKCRDHFPDIPSIIPINKDWNDDLCAFFEAKE